MDNKKPLMAHASMLTAEAIWGLMAPLGKDAMTHGIDGISLVSFRVAGAALLFWAASLFAKREHVPVRDILLFAGAAVLGIVCNQCLYTVGLSFTSPINASIVTTSMPIFAMVLSFFILREPITLRKAGGVAIGCSGAVILILTSMAATSDKVGDVRGDLMCMGAQLSFALYLSLYNRLIKRYHVVTVNKWMFAWAAVMVIPFTSSHLAALPWAAVPLKTWLETGYVVVFGTFVSYLLSIVSQRVLRPTVISVYNYVQPIVSVTVSVLTGLGVFTWMQGVAIILVFSGVWLVVKSKSRRDTLAEEA
jgi:Permeases of the drug/metabolite transporter (DMT) superfamily